MSSSDSDASHRRARLFAPRLVAYQARFLATLTTIRIEHAITMQSVRQASPMHCIVETHASGAIGPCNCLIRNVHGEQQAHEARGGAGWCIIYACDPHHVRYNNGNERHELARDIAARKRLTATW